MENTLLRPSQFDKHFDYLTREKEIYSMWEKAQVFNPDSAKNKNAPVFNISMPPPNANGELHLGHSFGYTVMDILGRFRRLLGDRVLLLPGKDHAGIQSQVVFEKKLKSEKVDIKSKSIQELFDECYAFCMDRAKYMRDQEKQLGLSADWSRELFTLDPRLTSIIYETFERMWKDGLIYKGTRIVNWSVFSQTAISDVEVEYKEQDGGLWYVSYQLSVPFQSNELLKLPNGKEIKIGEHGIVTATTRPETILGDTALAVHPEDPRYLALIGKEAIVPICGRKIRILADSRVDPAYGTGVIKVTPAHDFADYDIGQDHKLEILQVIGKDGKMTAEAGTEFAGMTTAACREAVVAKLDSVGLLLDKATIKHKVPIGERGKDIIEPLVSEQWFVNVDKPGKSLKGEALQCVRQGKIKIYPERFQVLFEQWLKNLRDWNISRQLWWGHRLPVWHKDGEIFVGQKAPTGEGWTEEKDIFDTWFSSGQWAFSTMAAHGLADISKTPTKSDFFPTHTMVMGRDILFFWACRMLLLTVYRTGDVPWKNIFFTGLVRDEHGQKMSKSKGNGIEPNKIMEKFGTDSLRLGLVMGATPGNDLALGERKIEGYSKFINKLWNASKLIEMKLSGLPPVSLEEAFPLTLESTKWILSKTNEMHIRVTKLLNAYDISIAADELYSFSWTTFCDWYLEVMKVLIDKGDPKIAAEVKYATLTSFRAILTMLHPFIPFVSEEIYQKLYSDPATGPLAASDWNALHLDGAVNSDIAKVMEIVTAVRSVKAALTIPHKRIRMAVSLPLTEEEKLLTQELSRADLCTEAEIPSHLALRKPLSTGIVVTEVEGKENYRLRLEKDVAMNQGIITTLEAKLAGSFAVQAKPEIVEKEREKLLSAKHVLKELLSELAGLG